MAFYTDNYLEIRNFKIYNSKVKENIKLTAVGDMHISPIFRNDKIAPVVNQMEIEDADYNLFLGDLFDSPDDIMDKSSRQLLITMLERSAAVAPTMVILGSHDYVLELPDKKILVYDKEFFDDVSAMDNVYLLNNNTYQDENIFFMGYLQTLDYYYGNLGKVRIENTLGFYNDIFNRSELYQNLPSNLPKIGLIHSPEYAKDEKNVELLKDYDLLIGGHDHDGCVPFGIGNFRRGIISPKKALFPKDVRGYRVLSSGTGLLINGGIVKIQNCAPKLLHPFNHLCPMQIDTVTLSSDKNFSESKKYVKVRRKY